MYLNRFFYLDLLFNYGDDQFVYDPDWKSWKSKNEKGNNY